MARHNSASVIENHIDPRLRARVHMDEIQSTFWGGVNATVISGGRLLCSTSETHPELHKAIQKMCDRAGVEVPMLGILESDIPNAFAAAKDRVVITTGMMQKLTFDELTAVIGHEIGHVQNYSRHMTNRRYVPPAMFAGLEYISAQQLNKWLPNTSALTRGGLTLASGIIGLKLGNNLVVRPTEYEADAVGAYVSGAPGQLASALEKVAPQRDGFSRTTVLSWLSGYPKAEHRIDRLRRMEVAQAMNPASDVPTEPDHQVMQGGTHDGHAIERAVLQR